MLEIEIKSIHNKEFINKVDFVDVPGLNESDSDYLAQKIIIQKTQ